MMDWLTACSMQKTPAVLVTVAMTEGSVPREAGAKMLVTESSQFDTIGGGHLEARAVEIARAMLSTKDDGKATRHLERFALGPSLGQCCGGVVHLAFERLDRAELANIAGLLQRLQRQEDTWRLIALDDATPVTFASRDSSETLLPALPRIDFERRCHVAEDSAGRRWLIDPCLAFRPHVVLFGAGHVGAAIVRAVADLPCRLTWIDERDDVFPLSVPSNVRIEISDRPEFLADQADAGSFFLVITHSHALDLNLCEHILRRPAREWLGLIGSTSKRKRFEHRLIARGIAQSRLDDLACPIGLPGITGKQPAIIAASVAAQLLQMWESPPVVNDLSRERMNFSVRNVDALLDSESAA